MPVIALVIGLEFRGIVAVKSRGTKIVYLVNLMDKIVSHVGPDSISCDSHPTESLH